MGWASDRTSEPLPTWAAPIFWFFRALGFVFAILLVALFAALLLGGFGESIRRWGWIAGALVGAIGYPLGEVKMCGGHKVNSNSAATSVSSEARGKKPSERQAGFFAGMLLGALAGAIVGALCGMFLIFGWVSFSLSPFAPLSWRSEIVTGFLSFAIKSPRLPLILFVAPVGLLALTGVVLGAIFPVSYRFQWGSSSSRDHSDSQ